MRQLLIFGYSTLLLEPLETQADTPSARKVDASSFRPLFSLGGLMEQSKMRRYSEAVQADVRRRMGPPHRQSVAQVSAQLGIHADNLFNWRKTWR